MLDRGPRVGTGALRRQRKCPFPPHPASRPLGHPSPHAPAKAKGPDQCQPCVFLELCGQPSGDPGLGHSGLCWVGVKLGRARLVTSGVRRDVPALAEERDRWRPV